MTRGDFYRALFDHGRAPVGSWGTPIEPGEEAEVAGILADAERAVRREFPGDAPDYDPAAAAWAAELFYAACQLTVHRAVGAEEIVKKFAPPQDVAPQLPGASPPYPDCARAESHYAVDLVFRFFPDLMRLAAPVATEDPLVKALFQLAGEWPLSSVGIDGVRPASIEPIVSHRGLLRCYVDRIMRHKDLSRLHDERVRKAVRAAIGIHAFLADGLEQALTHNP